jgi:Fe-S oxidoreductase
MSPNPALFKQMLLALLLLLVWTSWRRLSLVRLGRPTDRADDAGSGLWNVLQYALGQGRVVQRPMGINHALLFWSFLILAINHPLAAGTESLLEGVLPAGSLIPYPKGALRPMLLVLDILALVGLATAVVALVRWLVAPPYKGRTAASFALPAIFVLIFAAYFGVNAFKLDYYVSAEAGALAHTWMPVSSLAAGMLAAVPMEGLYGVSWWGHGIAILLLLLLLPYGKFFHMVTAIPAVCLRRGNGPLLPPREEFTAGRRFGVGRVDDYSRKDLLDGFACTECGRCQEACPARATGKTLDPSLVVRAIHTNLQRNAPALKAGSPPPAPLLTEGEGADGTIGEAEVWDCTTCGACMAQCPVGIEQMPKILSLRRHLVQMESRFPEELLSFFEHMENRSNPWGIAPGERTKWCTSLEARPFVADETVYLFYVGCAGAFDSRNKQVTLATARILDAAGVSWGILGRDERCCGESLRRLGNEYLFDRMARENVELFRRKGVKKVITQCPHCYTVLKNDYGQYGLELEVVHHSQFIKELVAAGRLSLNPDAAATGTTVFHDSCYLGRHNGVAEEPRQVIAAATGAPPLEMGRSRRESFCCGAGGGRMWLEEHRGTRINRNRVGEAVTLDPDTICVSCPYCLTMFEDGLKDTGAGDIRVRDISEVVVAAMAGGQS